MFLISASTVKSDSSLDSAPSTPVGGTIILDKPAPADQASAAPGTKAPVIGSTITIERSASKGTVVIKSLPGPNEGDGNKQTGVKLSVILELYLLGSVCTSWAVLWKELNLSCMFGCG